MRTRVRKLEGGRRITEGQCFRNVAGILITHVELVRGSEGKAHRHVVDSSHSIHFYKRRVQRSMTSSVSKIDQKAGRDFERPIRATRNK